MDDKVWCNKEEACSTQRTASNGMTRWHHPTPSACQAYRQTWKIDVERKGWSWESQPFNDLTSILKLVIHLKRLGLITKPLCEACIPLVKRPECRSRMPDKEPCNSPEGFPLVQHGNALSYVVTDTNSYLSMNGENSSTVWEGVRA